MGRTNRDERPLTDRGFTILETLLVVALSGILVVGLTSMMEMPNEMAARQDSANPSLASADIALAQLERDVRFATDVRVPSATRVELDQADGSTVAWEHTGAVTGTLVRSQAGSSVTLRREVDGATFTLVNSSYVRRVEESRPVAEAAVTVGTFNQFTLKPGFRLGATLGLILGVLELPVMKSISNSQTAGIFLTPGSLGGNLGVPTGLRLRLERQGTGDVLINVYEANPTTHLPIRTTRAATGRLYNRQIPVTLGDVSIPLTMERKLDPAKSYFVDIRSPSGASAKIEGKTLSLLNAAASAASTFMTSNDGGSTLAGLVGRLDASQTSFTLDAVKVSVDTTTPGPVDGLQPGYETVDVPVAVTVKLGLRVNGAVETILAAYPLANKLAVLNR